MENEKPQVDLKRFTRFKKSRRSTFFLVLKILVGLILIMFLYYAEDLFKMNKPEKKQIEGIEIQFGD